jgi:hypothetical protein
MAHFAKLGKGNIVEKVEVVSNDIATTEQAGVEFLQNLYGDRSVWKQTSYNTVAGKHYTISDQLDNDGFPITIESTDQSKAFRKNYAGIGWKYDQTKDAFIPPKPPYESWTLNETTCQWQAPVTKPELTEQQLQNGSRYIWNETNQTWDFIDNS